MNVKPGVMVASMCIECSARRLNDTSMFHAVYFCFIVLILVREFVNEVVHMQTLRFTKRAVPVYILEYMHLCHFV